MDDDFNLQLIINQNKDLRFQIDKMKEKFGIQDDPTFNQINEKHLIDLDGGENLNA